MRAADNRALDRDNRMARHFTLCSRRGHRAESNVGQLDERSRNRRVAIQEDGAQASVFKLQSYHGASIVSEDYVAAYHREGR